MSPEDLIAALGESRAKFLRHVDGMTDQQCRWKPYPECMSVNETLMHLMVDDLAATESLTSGKEPDYDGHRAKIHAEGQGLSKDELVGRLMQSHNDFITSLRGRYGNSGVDEPICVWGDMKPLGLGIPFFTTEDSYHSGQVAFIRQAQDPEWNYYAHIYGAG